MVNRRRSSFGAVELLPSGRFRVRYRADGQMQRAPQTFDSRSDARKYLDTVRADIVRQTWRAPRKVTETVGSYGMRWLAERTGIKVTTHALYEPICDCTSFRRWAMCDSTSFDPTRCAPGTPACARH